MSQISKTRWTRAELRQLASLASELSHYPFRLASTAARQLGRSPGAVRLKLRQMRLYRDVSAFLGSQ